MLLSNHRGVCTQQKLVQTERDRGDAAKIVLALSIVHGVEIELEAISFSRCPC